MIGCPRAQRLRLGALLRPPLGTPMGELVFCPQHAIEGRFGSKIFTPVGQARHDLARWQVAKLRRVRYRQKTLALQLAPACLPEHAASAGAYRLVPSHAAASVAPCVRLAPAPHRPEPGAPPPRRPQSTKPALAGALKDRSFDLVLPERLELFLQNQQRRRLCQGLLFAQQLALQLLVFILQRTQLPRPRRRFFATQTKGLFPTRQVMGKQTPFPAPCL